MLHDELNKYIAQGDCTIVDAMRKINLNSSGLLYVVDEDNHLKGCLTDGDIRRWIIKNGNIEGIIDDAMNCNPSFLYENEKSAAKDKMSSERISSLAIIDDSCVVKEIVFRDELLQLDYISGFKDLSNTSVIIMAGGLGTRLYPYTKILPKPLIPIGDVPILERILSRFYEFGCTNFFLTVNYKKEMIKSYFSESRLPYSITFVEEPKLLGTAGSIHLIKETFNGPVVISNCDILIEANYSDILRFHVFSGNDMTIVSSLKNTEIPYGVIYLNDDGSIASLEEKPHYSNFINTGMYVVNPELLELIPSDKVFHMTDLTELLLKEKKRVGVYPIDENSFLDMGQFEEMKKMESRISQYDER